MYAVKRCVLIKTMVVSYILFIIVRKIDDWGNMSKLDTICYCWTAVITNL